MSRIDNVPRTDHEPEGPFEPRAVTFEAPRRVRRRGFLAVVTAGAMTLGLTALGWIPFARPARARPGTEYLNCGRYDDGEPGGPVCTGFPYSPENCGDDDWFRDGCVTNSDGSVDCYRPLPICEAGSDGGRNAWRWQDNGTLWRCADGEVQQEGAPNPETVVCNANLSDASEDTSEDASESEPEPEPTSNPTPTATSTSTEPPLPLPIPIATSSPVVSSLPPLVP